MASKKTEGAVFSQAQPAAANFANEKTRKHRKPQDHLEYDVMRAHELGYGPHYGDYKADHPYTREEFEATAGMVKVKKAQPMEREKKCLQCGAVFFVKQYITNKKYCCEQCRLKAKNNGQKQRATPGKTTTCGICGATFTADHHSRIYCSTECYTESQRRRDRERRRKQKEEKKNGRI